VAAHGWLNALLPEEIAIPPAASNSADREAVTEDDTNRNVGESQPPQPLVKIRDVSCDGGYFCAVSRDGALYSWGMCTGDSVDDEWGLGHMLVSRPFPCLESFHID
jgi:alpha-tubulin suppressor-like RCC1 family protein